MSHPRLCLAGDRSCEDGTRAGIPIKNSPHALLKQNASWSCSSVAELMQRPWLLVLAPIFCAAVYLGGRIGMGASDYLLEDATQPKQRRIRRVRAYVMALGYAVAIGFALALAIV